MILKLISQNFMLKQESRGLLTQNLAEKEKIDDIKHRWAIFRVHQLLICLYRWANPEYSTAPSCFIQVVCDLH